MADDRINDAWEASESMGEFLLNQFLADSGENLDMEALEEWLSRHPEARKAFIGLQSKQAFRERMMLSRELEETLSGDREKILSQIQSVPSPAVLPVSRKIFHLVSAAAACLIIGFSIYILHRQTPTGNPTHSLSIAQDDVAPGSQKAVLTLSNGRTITLDSASNGLLAQQGKVNVLKSAQGQLNYQAGKAASSEIVYNTMTTPRGGTFKLTLSDGTKVWLNAASSLRYPVSFAGSKLREVSLTGEGYFEIAPNKSVPFTVTTGGTIVKVLGTAFDVMAYDDERQLQTTLLDGAVAVSSNNQTSVLKPGQQAQINNENGTLFVANVDAGNYIAWKDGLIQLHHADIPAIMRQISRWYDVQIKYEGTNVPSWTSAGRISRGLNLSQVLQVLELDGIHCKLDGRTITVIF